jgi:predicted lipoprotein with Yx(FWY)xxD motif
MKRSFLAPMVSVIALALIAAGCGAGDEEADTTSTSAQASATLPETEGGGELMITSAPSSLGRVLVDGSGRSLYVLISDVEGTGQCIGSCADIWPPVVYDDTGVLGEEVDSFLLGDTAREDGGRVFPQATYNGQPLYTYSGDSAPGDVNGHGVDLVWFLIDTTGAVVAAPAEAPSGAYGY